MELKLLGLADTHLKESNKEIVISIFKQAVTIAKKHQLKRIYHLGDIFNSRKAQSQEVLLAFKEILDMLASEDISLVAIPGNHDKTDYSSWDSFLDPFNEHSAFSLIKQSAVGYENSMNLFFIPYIEPQQYIDALTKLTKVKESGFKCLLTHIDINGAVMNNGSVIQNPITTDLFKAFDKVIVGHYHDKQTLQPNIHFVGASLQHSFGEAADKGMWGLTTTYELVHIPLSFPQYITQRIDAASFKPADVKNLLKNKKGDNKVRVILEGDEASLKSFDKEQLLTNGIAIKLEKKAVNKVKEEEEGELIIGMDSLSIVGQFESFCKEKELEYKVGVQYLKQALQQTV